MDAVDAMTLAMRWSLAAALVNLGVFSGQQVSWAQSEDSQPVENPPALPRLSVSLTGVYGMTFGSHCPTQTSDAVMCPSPAAALTGLRLAPRVRVSDDWAFGLTAGTFFLGDPGGVTIRWWDVQISTRYFLGRPSSKQYWTEVSLGFAAATEAVPSYNVDGLASVVAHSNVIWAPAAAIAVGKDFGLTRYFGISPEIRAMYLGFRTGSMPFDYYYEPQMVVLLGVSLIGLGAYH